MCQKVQLNISPIEVVGCIIHFGGLMLNCHFSAKRILEIVGKDNEELVVVPSKVPKNTLLPKEETVQQ